MSFLSILFSPYLQMYFSFLWMGRDRGKAAVGKALGVQAEEEGNGRWDLASALGEPAGIHPHQQAHHVNQPSLSGENMLSPN